MSYWAQHGYGKSNKLEVLGEQGLLAGAILSPADEEADQLAVTAASVRAHGARALMDPQLYIHTIPGGTARCHETHGIDFGQQTWLLTATDVQSQVQAIVAANDRVNTDAVIAPSPYLPNIGGRWDTLSFQYAQATLQEADKSVLVSLVAENLAFTDWENVIAYLDALTTLDASGVYLIVGHAGGTYPPIWNQDLLCNVLRTIYILAELNDYEVIWGYADLPGLAGLAAGATGAATGWFHALRMWSPNKWIPQTGGRSPHPRYFSIPLLSSLDVAGEVLSVAGTSISGEVVPDTDLLQRLADGDQLDLPTSRLQHMTAIAEVLHEVDVSLEPSDRVDSVLTRISGALNLFEEATQAGATLAPAHRSRLRAIRIALESFAEAEDL